MFLQTNSFNMGVDPIQLSSENKKKKHVSATINCNTNPGIYAGKIFKNRFVCYNILTRFYHLVSFLF